MTAERKVLPARRGCETFELMHANNVYIVSMGHFEDGRLSEVFVNGTKIGTDVEAIARDGAVMLSIALQYGVPLAVIASAITRGSDGTPSSITGAIVDTLAKETAI